MPGRRVLDAHHRDESTHAFLSVIVDPVVFGEAQVPRLAISARDRDKTSVYKVEVLSIEAH